MINMIVCVISLLFLTLNVYGSQSNLPRDIGPDEVEGRKVWKLGSEPNNISITWKLLEDVPEGSWLRIRANGLHGLSSCNAGSIKAGVHDIAIEHRYSRDDLMKRWMYYVANPYIAAGKSIDALKTGTEILFSGEFQARPSASQKEITTTAGVQYFYRLEQAQSFDGPWRPVSKWFMIETISAEPLYIEAVIRADESVHIVYLDKFRNPAMPGKREITVSDMNDNIIASTVTSQREWVRIAKADIKGKPLWVKVKDNKGFMCISSPRQQASDGMKVCFGDLHWHTEYSGDGFRPIYSALDSAKNQLGFDFASLGDHYRFKNNYPLDEYLDVMDYFNEPGVFAAVYGYEISTGVGHFNPYYRNRQAAYKFDTVIPKFYEELPKNLSRLPLMICSDAFGTGEAIFIPHHTNATSGSVVNEKGYSLWRNFDWSQVDARIVQLAEMCQARGSFEQEIMDPDWAPKGTWKTTGGVYGSSICSALARGLRFGFVAGSDNHEGWPSRNNGSEGYCAATGIIVNEITREAIFDSMTARRTYATTGERIVMEFTLNEKYPMGSEVKLPMETKRNFKIRVIGKDVIDKAEIISYAMKIADLPTDGSRKLEMVWTDSRPDAPLDDCYYYLRVRQKNGHCAWSSPIWIDYQN